MMLPSTGILPLARATFDVPYAEDRLAAMIGALETAGVPLAGPRALLLDADAAHAAMDALKRADVAQILILQVTFTDAELTAEIASGFDAPLSIWAVPEPRAGGRLRLNSFCGLNLASHALGLRQRPFSYLYAAPEAPEISTALRELLGGARQAEPPAFAEPQTAGPGSDAAAALRGLRIGRIGAHPAGFDTCAYDAANLRALAGVEVETLALDELFGRARAVPDAEVGVVRSRAEHELADLDAVDQRELDRSLRLKCALDAIKAERGLDAFAIRCWPETFTEYGGAVCGPVAMMGEERTPCACEADVYGALSARLMQEIAGAPVFLVDVVDLDPEDDTGVVWHCGQAPISMRDPDVTARATIHTNRRMPLLYEFPLKPGRVTFARISQARGAASLAVAGGEMLRRPMAFTGTSGVVRFDAPAEAVMRRVIGGGLEHHIVLAYGDHRAALLDAASALRLPVVELA